MRRTRLARTAAALIAAATVLAASACDTGEPSAEAAAADGGAAPGMDGASPRPGQDAVHVPEVGPALAVDAGRRRADVVSGGPRAPYNYAPSVLREGTVTKAWWCSQLPGAGPSGDDVLYATAPGPDGPFTAPGEARAAPVLTGSGAGFDAVHTCDPSVVHVGGTYYLYYTGSAGDREHGNAVGVATSTDGVHWQRAGGGRPIVLPSMGKARDNTYGVGQPSVLYLDGWFYLLYTDTSNRSAGWNGAGQFVLRSTDPTFATGVQGLSDGGFVGADQVTPGNAKSIVDAFSADWMFSDALNAFAVAHETRRGTTVTFYDRTLSSQPYKPIVLRGPWQEGPGLVRRGDGHAPVSRTDPCGRVPVDVLRATTGAASPTQIGHFGVDITGVRGCRGTGQALALLRGHGVVSPERTVDVVADGGLVRVERRSVAGALAAGLFDTRVRALDRAPVLARIAPSVPAVRADGRPVGLVLSDGNLWPVGDPRVAALNSSAASTVPPAQWDSYPRGPDLSRLRSEG